MAAPDLRAGAALVIAGMMAEGYTYVDDIKFIERGYEDFDEKLRGIGANIIKAECEKILSYLSFQYHNSYSRERKTKQSRNESNLDCFFCV